MRGRPAFPDGLQAALRRRARAAARDGRPLQAWVTPCGSGARAYAVAVILIEALGRRWRETSLRVLASDDDAAAVARARAGFFSPQELPWLSTRQRARFFSEEPQGLRARRLLREVCLFTTSDAARASSTARLDVAVISDGLVSFRARRPGGRPAPPDDGPGEDFLAEVVHELRAPMAVIQGFAETLRLGVRKRKDRKEFLRAIESHTGRAARLVDRLLELSAARRGRETVDPKPVPAAAAAAEVAAAFAPLARRRDVSLSVDVPEELVARVDPADFPHILGNLIDNAVKFSARGGAVTVRGRAEETQALFSVEDAGPGVPPDELELIFKRFHRGRRGRGVKGTGLGLAIVRAMAKANGGRVWAENRACGGAVFHVALPLEPVLESSS